MAKLLTILGPCALAALWSCSLTGEAGSEVQSCYDTGHGIVCTTSSELGDDETDADGDGEADELVCGDADSSAESMDGDSGEDDGTDDDGTDDDGAMTATGEGEDDDGDDEESDGEGESTSDSDSEDCASSDGDDDNDGMDDAVDCDCAGDEPVPAPEDPCTDCTPPE